MEGNDTLHHLDTTISIESIGFGGAGVGRLPDGRICFVPLTLPGERVSVSIVKEKKSFAEAKAIRLVESSIDRIPPRCPLFGKCGGCAYQHLRYEKQLEVKAGQVRDLLARFGGIAGADVRPMLPSPDEWNYRNRLGVHVQEGKVGFYERKSNRLIPASGCPIASPEVNVQLAELAANPPRGNQRITLREKSDFFGFSQVNRSAAELLADVVCGMLENEGGHLVDAYCGAGFFTKRLREKFRAVTGIEWSHGAVHAARASAGAGENYLEGAVELHLPAALAASPAAETALLVDPPAEGLSHEVVEAILANPPSTIVCVSCDPSTLARDLKRLSTRYALNHIQPVDMFPQTAEIESVALLKIL
ncbi:MAG: class I SAM-dependent RNA methyltransferase [Verrucomicrobiaceae bacterium]|nr:MAG: class I SAM-dependent RNA methyltransferase [Verrucomicrobiaceae bacterium]